MSDQTAAGQPLPPGAKPTNPFAGLPVRDVLRDLGALSLLIAALFYDWSSNDSGVQSGAELWYVDVSLVAAIGGLSLSYLWKLGVLGAAWNVGSNQLYRLLATVPYFLSVLVVVIFDIADDRGVGVGVAVGIFGAILAAQPRTHELPATVLAGSDRVWLFVTAGLTGLASVLIALSTLLFIDDLDDGGAKAGGVVILVVAGLLIAAVLALPIIGILGARPSAVALVAGTGIVVVLLGALHIDGQNITQLLGFPVLFGGYETLDVPGYGAFALAAAAAAALSPGASRSTGGAAHPISLVGAAKGGFLVLAVAAVVHLLGVIFPLAGFDGAELEAPGIVTLIVYVLAAALAVLGFVTTAPQTAKTLPLAAAGGYALLIVAQVIVIAIVDEGYVGFVGLFQFDATLPTDSWLAAIVAAAVIAVALVGPQAVGSAAKSLGQRVQTANDPTAAQGAPLPGAPVAPAPAAPAPAAPVAPAPAAPAAPVAPAPLVPEATAIIPAVAPEPPAPAPEPPAPAPAPPVDPIVQQASDPATPQAELARIAEHHPHARAAVAANPSAYQGLLDWLAQVGDPAVDEALRNRRG